MLSATTLLPASPQAASSTSTAMLKAAQAGCSRVDGAWSGKELWSLRPAVTARGRTSRKDTTTTAAPPTTNSSNGMGRS